MSDFLIYAARLQDAGITRLLVTIDTAKDRTRMMHVSPMLPIGDQRKYPTRTFELCGTDRVLERVKDDMAYSDDGPTAEKVEAAIAAHPLLADDLREWFSDYLLSPMQYVKGILRGTEVRQTRKAMTTPETFRNQAPGN